MRTDEHIAQNRQFYDSQRYQSDRATAGIVGNYAANAQQSQMNQQAMEQQQLQGALMEKQVESDMRMQEATMEQQFHRNKMDQILMMDQVAMSHENRRGAKLQNDHAEFAFKEKVRAASTESETSTSQTLGGLIERQGFAPTARIFKSQGKIPVLSDGKWSLRKGTPEEIEKAIKDNAGQTREARLAAQDAATQAHREKQFKLSMAGLKKDLYEPDSYGDRKFTDEQAGAIIQEAGGQPLPRPSSEPRRGPKATPPVNGETPQQGTLPANDNARRSFIGEQITTTSIDGRTTMEDSTKQFYINAIDEALPKLRELQRQVWAPGRQGKSDEELVRFVAKILSNSGHPRHQSMLRILDKAAPNAKWSK